MKLTVVTASYNALSAFGLEKIRACVYSVAALPVEHEHLIYDGASTDDTVEELRKLEKEIPSLKVASEKDTGIYDALNKGVRDAKGDYFYVLGMDDEIIDPAAFCACLERAIKGRYDIFIAQVKRMDGVKEVLTPISINTIYKEISSHSVCHQGMLTNSSMMRRFPFDIKYKIVADAKQQLLLHLAGAKIGWMKVIIAKFGNTGISSKYWKTTFDEYLKVITEIYGLNEKELIMYTSCAYIPFRVIWRFIKSGSFFSFMMGLRTLPVSFWHLCVFRKEKDHMYSTYYLFNIPIYWHIKKSLRQK